MRQTLIMTGDALLNLINFTAFVGYTWTLSLLIICVIVSFALSKKGRNTLQYQSQLK